VECHWFIYVGVYLSTRIYEDITCKSWEYIHTWIEFFKILIEQIRSYKQYYVFNDSQIDVSFEIEKISMNIQQNMKHAARKTQIDSQVKKKTYIHDIDS